jgi:tryptophan synthase beta chain
MSLAPSRHNRVASPAKGGVPDAWLNVAVQTPYSLPLPQDGRGHPETVTSLARVYSEECARIEMLDGLYGREPFISVPGLVMDEYRKYRPTPLQRACGLERRLGYAGQIYFKREDGNPSGSHKPNTAIPQAFYGRAQGLRGLVTDTGAGQWGAALAWACHNQNLACTVFMTRNSYQSKPYRRYLMELCGGTVIPSPSECTEQGRTLLRADPDHQGSLGIGMSEAITYMQQTPGARLALGCMSYYAALHQSIIGQEVVEQLAAVEVEPDVLIGCVGGGTNFMGFVAPFVVRMLRQPHSGAGSRPRLLAVESANIPVLTKGEYRYEHADAFGFTPQVKMYTLGRQFVPDKIHAGGLRYHGKSPILSLLVHHAVIEAAAVDQKQAFEAGRVFFEAEGILPAPESCHAIAQVLVEVEQASQEGRNPTIIFCLSGTGYLDLQGYASFFGLT